MLVREQEYVRVYLMTSMSDNLAPDIVKAVSAFDFYHRQVI